MGQLIVGTPWSEVEDDVRHDLLVLRRHGVNWSSRLADFFEEYMTHLTNERTVQVPRANEICLGLQNAGLHGFAAIARIRFGTLMACDMGREWVAKGETFMVEQAVRKPVPFSNVFAPA